ncbi:hypothetical protein LCGC14_0721670 [marine sediment metagenome]|uniref:Uncharacterized protein n=1 Tax=marine sediment metagenome TaxID=412755 RepID=A0A0F9QC83_9ZZZZ
MMRYPKYFDTSLKYFPILILYTLLNELLGVLIYKFDTFSLEFNNMYSDNYIVIYTIYNILFFLYFFYLFRFYITNEAFKKLIKYGSMFFLATCLINPVFQNLYTQYQYFIFFSGALLLIMSVLLYIKEQKENGFQNLKNNVLFWIGLGLLLYHVGYIPIKVIRFQNELTGQTEISTLRTIHFMLLVFMYTCFIIGFLRLKKRLPR